MKLRSSKKVRFEDELDNDNANDNDTDKEVYSFVADDSLIEDNKIWFSIIVILIFSINYLYGYTQSKINTTETIIYW
jgi:hypothetical protein